MESGAARPSVTVSDRSWRRAEATQTELGDAACIPVQMETEIGPMQLAAGEGEGMASRVRAASHALLQDKGHP